MGPSRPAGTGLARRGFASRRLATVATIAATVVSAGLALAAGLTVSGAVRFPGAAPARVRVGLFVLDRAGHPTQEVTGSAAAPDGAFTLQVPDRAPAAGSRLTLTQDMLAWPGVVGNVAFSGTPRAALARLGAYLDNDNSGGFSPSDTLLDSTATRSTPGGIIVLWADARFQATAGRGFSATFEPGWNLFTVEAGKTVTATRVNRLDNLRLDVFPR